MQVQTSFHPIVESGDHTPASEVLAQKHDGSGRLASVGNLVIGKKEEGGLAPSLQKEVTLAAMPVQGEDSDVRPGLVDFFQPATGERRRQLRTDPAKNMTIHGVCSGRGPAVPGEVLMKKAPCGAGSRLFAADGFAFFLAAFAVDAQLGHRAGLEAGDADLFAAIFANAVGAVLNTLNGGLDFPDEPPLPIAQTQGE